jgi:hypothetical protein
MMRRKLSREEERLIELVPLSRSLYTVEIVH